jgi:hypothetical protein
MKCLSSLDTFAVLLSAVSRSSLGRNRQSWLVSNKSRNPVQQVLTALSKQRDQLIELAELYMVHLDAGCARCRASIDLATYAKWDLLDLPCTETTLQ